MHVILFVLSFFLSLAEASKYHLIWQARGCEMDWIRECLSQLDFDEIEDGAYSVFIDNAIIVVAGGCEEKNYLPYFQKLLEQGYTFGVIQTGDERYKASLAFYDQVKFVIRNYWDERHEGKSNVMQIPLGYINKFKDGASAKNNQMCHKRKYVWSFAGDIHKSTRTSMCKNMKQIEGGYLHSYKGFLGPKALSIQSYRSLLQDSIFSPAPTGFYNLESFRVYEALECGSIPIVEKKPFDYFAHLLGNYPFISINSWSEAPKIIKKLQSNPAKLEKLRSECFKWWADYKQNLKCEIKEFIETRMEF